MQMGPALLPTPLLPARGPPKRDLAANVPRLVRTTPEGLGDRWRMHRCSRRHPVPSGFGSDPKIFPVPFGFRDRTFLLAGSLKRFCNYQGFEAEVLAIPSIPNRIVRPIVTLRSRSDHRSSQRPVETFL